MIKCRLCNSANLIARKEFPTSKIANVYNMIVGFRPVQLSSYETIVEYECSACGTLQFFPEIVGDGEFYSALSKDNPNYYPTEKYEFDVAHKLSDNNSIVFDYGCGDAFAFDKIQCKKYIGVDFNPSRRKPKDSRFIAIDATVDSDFSEYFDKIDVLISFQVLEHVVDVQSYLENCAKLVKKGGKFLLAVPATDGILSVQSNAIFDFPPHHQNRFTTKSMEFIKDKYNFSSMNIVFEPIHKSMFAYFLSIFLEEILFSQDRRLDDSIFRFYVKKVLNRISVILAKRIRSEKLLPNGWSMIAVFEK